MSLYLSNERLGVRWQQRLVIMCVSHMTFKNHTYHALSYFVAYSDHRDPKRQRNVSRCSIVQANVSRERKGDSRTITQREHPSFA